MSSDKIFVGRKDELEQFKKVLAEPQGQAVLVVGQAGMGKSMLLERMEQMVSNRKDCGVVRYLVTSKYSVEMLMERMINDAFEAAQCTEKAWDSTERQRKQ